MHERIIRLSQRTKPGTFAEYEGIVESTSVFAIEDFVAYVSEN